MLLSSFQARIVHVFFSFYNSLNQLLTLTQLSPYGSIALDRCQIFVVYAETYLLQILTVFSVYTNRLFAGTDQQIGFLMTIMQDLPHVLFLFT